MSAQRTPVPAIEGWFTMDPDDPRLVGSRCTACGTAAFPPGKGFCGNPDCVGAELEDTLLSRRGRLWSYTDAQYAPPAPFIAPEPYEPFAIGAVELDSEQMVVIGQMVPGVTVEDLTVGDEVELVLGTLYADEDHEYVMWQWRPVSAAEGGAQGRAPSEWRPVSAAEGGAQGRAPSEWQPCGEESD